MRITDLYDLKNRKSRRDEVMKSLMYDIETIAEIQFSSNEFRKFAIKIKLEPINKYE